MVCEIYPMVVLPGSNYQGMLTGSKICAQKKRRIDLILCSPHERRREESLCGNADLKHKACKVSMRPISLLDLMGT